MSRRRYLSTDISIDTAVNRLARTAGDFAVMLYTWMIPHCDDDGIVHGDAEEIILQVIPGRRDKKIEDVTAALAGMQEHGLIQWDQDGRRVIFPSSSFYKYQTYIKPERRRGAEPKTSPEPPQDAEISANQRKSAQNTVSHSLSHPVKHSHSEEPPVSLRSTSPKGGRGARIPPHWPPEQDFVGMIAFGQEHSVGEQQVLTHISEFHDYWSQATKNATSLDWVKRWRGKFAEDVRVGRVGGSPRASPNGNGYRTAGEKAQDGLMRLAERNGLIVGNETGQAAVRGLGAVGGHLPD